MNLSNMLQKVLTEIKSDYKIEKFLSVASEDVVVSQLERTKDLYDSGHSVYSSTEPLALPSLLVNGFDAEQIWQQLEIGCNNDQNAFTKRIDKILTQSDLVLRFKNNSNSTDCLIADHKLKNKEEKKIAAEMDKKGMKSSNRVKEGKTADKKLRDILPALGSDLESDDDDDDDEDFDDDDVDDDDDDDDEILDKHKNSSKSHKTTKEDDEVDDDDDDGIDAKLQKALDDVASDDSSDETDLFASKKSKNSKENETEKPKEKPKEKPGKKKSRGKKSVVDDKFFRLSDMEAFVEEGERREMKGEREGSEDDDDDDEILEDEDDSDNDVMAGDFFDAPDDADQMKDDDDDDDDDNDDDDDDVVESADEEEVDFWKQTQKSKEEKSSYEKRMEKMKAKVSELEEQNLSVKPWQMQGEVGSSSRPENSLLSELLDYEHIARQPPMITEEVTKTEESFIIQRIKDRAWDDVVRKVKPSDLGMEYRKRVVLNQEKSKISLAEQYASEYQKEVEKMSSTTEVIEKEDEAHKEIRQDLEKLFIKLDALSNFHFTPKPVLRDIEIITNEASITVEEVAPTHLSEANTLAPEQVLAKTSGELVGATERTETDRKRERRRKKKRQRMREREKEEREKLKSSIGLKSAAKSKEKAMEEVIKKSKYDKSITVVKGTKTKDSKKNNKKTKSMSSSKFFEELQHDVVSTIKRKAEKNTKQESVISAKRLKL